MKNTSWLLLALVAFLLTGAVWAEETQAGITLEAEKGASIVVPSTVNYQGRLLGADGKPLSGTHALSIKIYPQAAEGNAVWGPQVFTTVPVVNGHFNLILGPTDTNGLALADTFTGNPDTWLQVTVDNAATPIAPRQRILSAPYAIQAAKSEYAQQLMATANFQTAEIALATIDQKTGEYEIIDDTTHKKLEVTLTSSGQSGVWKRPVMIGLQCPPNQSIASQIYVSLRGGSTDTSFYIRFYRDGYRVAEFLSTAAPYVSPSIFQQVLLSEQSDPGQHTYKVTIYPRSTQTVYLQNIQFYVYEL